LRILETGILTPILVVLFWAIAASLVMLMHLLLDPLSALAGAAAALAVLLLAALGYTRAVTPPPSVGHTLAVGAVWLTLGVVTEMAVTALIGHAWYEVLGSPARPLLRTVFLFAWIFTPALFARRDDDAGR
jgi:hypothetical protein